MSDESPVFEKIPVRVGDLFTFRVDAVDDFPGIEVVPHYHMMHELMWFRKSVGSFTIGNEKLAIENNTLIYVPALMIHEMSIPAQANHVRYLLQFEKEWLEEYALASDALQCGAMAILGAEDADRLEMLFNWCGEFSDFTDTLFRSLIRSILLHAFKNLKAAVHITARENNAYQGELIRLLKSIDVSENYEITTEEAARMCNWSKSWFSKTFKITFGISFKKFMLLRKINIAINLLANTELRIGDISQRAGFTDSAYFCLKFREMMNDTPLSFRLKVRSTTDVGSGMSL
ncbi:helix-turn-helix transcriptional regulator [Raoultella terrigena]|uniref:helix-turn-helix domain-containing protein n=1 Tax=Raoultella terrigena TaxID=577 RepID=UPI000F4C06CC|nr:helix-turn-helix transcriptional regulator [Raoultella terrigena]ROS03035.1 AraC-like DNA-binding protein [Raoultella terrigena]